jgi:hypothetical protein
MIGALSQHKDLSPELIIRTDLICDELSPCFVVRKLDENILDRSVWSQRC